MIILFSAEEVIIKIFILSSLYHLIFSSKTGYFENGRYIDVSKVELI